MHAMRLRGVTYNIHQFCGHRWRMNVARTMAALRALDADVLALQEVVSGCAFPNRRRIVGPEPYNWLARELGMHAVAVPAVESSSGKHGNVILTRLPILAHGVWNLAVLSHEPRNALYAILEAPWGRLRVVDTHFGLSAAERTQQVYRLLGHINADIDTPTILFGDFNEWAPDGLVSRALGRHFSAHGPIRTFPALAPYLQLDRIWWRPRSLVGKVTRPADPLFRSASDHAPVLAEILAPVPDASTDAGHDAGHDDSLRAAMNQPPGSGKRHG
jgi:endonuclease/exonuclease/phosphatase family metal-dependent hydrolase